MSKDYIFELYKIYDKFKYGKIVRINREDMEIDYVSRKRLFTQPLLFLIGGIAIIKLSPRFLSYMKNELKVGDVNLFSIKNSLPEQKMRPVYNKESLDKIKTEAKNQQSTTTYEELNSKITTTRRSKYVPQYRTVSNDTTPLSNNSNLSDYIDKKASESKIIKNLLEVKDTTNERWSHFTSKFLKITLIGVPLSLIIGSIVFDYYYTKFGLYLKYQPLVDSYYNHKLTDKNNKI